MSFRDKLMVEKRYRSILYTAKKLSYFNPKQNKKIDYEANNIFGRMIITLLTFTETSDKLVFKIKEDKISKKIIEKWESEMNEKRIKYNKNAMLNVLNGNIRPFNIKLEIPDVKKLINPKVMKRMEDKYYKHANNPTNAGFIEASTLVYIRYNTYDAWSQCWSVNNKDVNYPGDPKYMNIELFGSPFNTRKETSVFGTLFPDTDKEFGGYKRYFDLYHFILRMNKNKLYFNLFINPPFVEEIMDDLVDIVYDLKKTNNVVVLFPHWKNQEAYKTVKTFFDHFRINTEVHDLWTDTIITGVKTTTFFD